MKQEEILDYNKRCAEFLGSELKNDGQYNYWTYDHLGFNLMKISGSAWISGNFEFHSDWNWIMEVVEAIEKLDINKNKFSSYPFYQGFNLENNTYYAHLQFGEDLHFNGESKSKKEAVVQAINQFLIWYNENN